MKKVYIKQRDSKEIKILDAHAAEADGYNLILKNEYDKEIGRFELTNVNEWWQEPHVAGQSPASN